MLTLLALPAATPVTLEDARAWCRVDGTDEDPIIEHLIEVATARLDGRDGLLGRCLIEQQWLYSLEAFPASIALPLPPVISVDEIAYVDPAGDVQALDPSDYIVSGLGSMEGATIRPAKGKSWPAVMAGPEAIEVSFTAGFGDDPEDVPAPLRQAILLDVAHLHEHRESVLVGSIVTTVPHGWTDQVEPYRVRVF